MNKAFSKLALDDRELGYQTILKSSNDEILAQVANRPNAIGIVKYPFMRTEGVKLIAIDNIPPNAPNYPYQVSFEIMYPLEDIPAYAGDDVLWSYEGSNGPDYKGDLDPAFLLAKMGTSQSPIDIVDYETKPGEPLEFSYQPSQSVYTTMVNPSLKNMMAAAILCINQLNTSLSILNFIVKVNTLSTMNMLH